MRGTSALTVPETLGSGSTMIPIETGRDEALINEILTDVANGSSLNIACQKRKLRPAQFRDWMEGDVALREAYARAKNRQLEFWSEEVLDIASGARRLADAAAINAVFTDDKIAIMRDRLAADQARWTLSKLLPKTFGDRVFIDTADQEARPPLTQDEIEAARNAFIEQRGNT